MTTSWKNRFVQTGLLATMVMVALGSAGIASATAAEEKQQTIATKAIPGTATSTMISVSGNAVWLQQPAFQRNYLKLLVNTYAPETSEEWKKALDERKQVESELVSKEAKPVKPADNTAGATISFTKVGTVVKEGVTLQAVPVEGRAEGVIINTELSEAAKRQQKLAEAVDADDAVTIRSLLPELLKDYRSETDKLRELTAALKDPSNPALQAKPVQK